MNRVHEIFHWWSICELSPFPVSSPVSESLHSSFSAWCSSSAASLVGDWNPLSSCCDGVMRFSMWESWVLAVMWFSCWSDGVTASTSLSSESEGFSSVLEVVSLSVSAGFSRAPSSQFEVGFTSSAAVSSFDDDSAVFCVLSSCSSSCTAFSISCMAQSMADLLSMPCSELSVVLSSLLVYFCLLVVCHQPHFCSHPLWFHWALASLTFGIKSPLLEYCLQRALPGMIHWAAQRHCLLSGSWRPPASSCAVFEPPDLLHALHPPPPGLSIFLSPVDGRILPQQLKVRVAVGQNDAVSVQVVSPLDGCFLYSWNTEGKLIRAQMLVWRYFVKACEILLWTIHPCKFFFFELVMFNHYKVTYAWLFQSFSPK